MSTTSRSVAQRHSHAAYVSTVRSLSGMPGPLRSADEIETERRGPWSLAQEKYVAQIFSSHIVGSPSSVEAGLQALAQRTGADEIMVATIMHGYADRLRSYELIAKACLTVPPRPQSPDAGRSVDRSEC
jgi:alkanesulfonate monooxygenase SsuD/methylene tetrahydromethanopterin reductase-like flavin-dependent oxidoreductase (luciferase family)